MKYNDYVEFDNILPEISFNKVVDETTKEGIAEYYSLLKNEYLTAVLNPEAANKELLECNNKPNFAECEIICKVTNFCNQRCKYCFDKNNQAKPKIVLSKEKIMKLLKLLHKKGFHRIEWVWHGGECLSVDKKWFDEICFEMWKYSKENNFEIIFNAQTNGTLLDDEWIFILDKYNIPVGTSYDWSGQSNRGYELSKEKLSKFYLIISVITEENVKNLINDFKIASKNKVPFSFNFVFGNSEHQTEDFLNTTNLISEYKKYLDYFLYNNDSMITERSVVAVINKILNGPADVCNLGNCLLSNRICINSDGKLYKCDDTNIQEMYICDIEEIEDIDEFFYNPKIHQLLNIKKKQFKEKCLYCEFSSICCKGCINCTFRESKGEEPYSVYCHFIKEIGPYIYEKLGNLTPEEFVKLNPIVKQQLIEKLYLPAYIKEEIQKAYDEYYNI